MISKAVEKLVESAWKLTVGSSKVEKLMKLSVHKMKQNHRLVSTLVANLPS